jgi:hypothetical protein
MQEGMDLLEQVAVSLRSARVRTVNHDHHKEELVAPELGEIQDLRRKS